MDIPSIARTSPPSEPASNGLGPDPANRAAGASIAGRGATPSNAWKAALDQALDGKGSDSKLADSKRAQARLPQAPANPALANALLAEPLDKSGMAARKAAARAAQYGTPVAAAPSAAGTPPGEVQPGEVGSGELQAGSPRLALQPGMTPPVQTPPRNTVAALDGGAKAALPQLFMAGRGAAPAGNPAQTQAQAQTQQAQSRVQFPGTAQAAAPGIAPAPNRQAAARSVAPAEAPMPRPAHAAAVQAGRGAYARAAQPQTAANPLRDGLAAAEGTAGEPCRGYTVRNTRSGALGRYQLLPVALVDIGWKDGQGRWTDRAAAAGVQSEADFLGRPAAQEAAMASYLQRTGQQLAANGVLAQAGRSLPGVDGRPIVLTETGLIAAAHRQGAGAVARWLEHRSERPEAALTPAQRTLFISIETRLRNFAALPGDNGRLA